MKALMTWGGRKQRTGSEGPVSIIHTTTYRRRERTLDAVIAISFVAFCALLGWAGASFL